MNSKTIILGAVAIAVLGVLIYKFVPTTGTDTMPGMNHSAMTSTDATPATKAYETAMAAMMKGMMSTPTGKPDLDFMQDMIPHHQGAVAMAKTVLQYGKDPEVKAFAENVVKAQEGEINFMSAWLASTDRNALVASPEATKANLAAMAQMKKAMMVPYSGDADVDFVKGMIPHHQGAINAAKVALQFAKDPVVLKLAQDITTAQESEITFMKAWLERMGK